MDHIKRTARMGNPAWRGMQSKLTYPAKSLLPCLYRADEAILRCTIILFHKRTIQRQNAANLRAHPLFCLLFHGDFANIRMHGLWLPGHTIIPTFLIMTDGFKKSSSAEWRTVSKSNFVIEFHKSFHNYTSAPAPATFLGYFPWFLDIGSSLQHSDRDPMNSWLVSQRKGIPISAIVFSNSSFLLMQNDMENKEYLSLQQPGGEFLRDSWSAMLHWLSESH